MVVVSFSPNLFGAMVNKLQAVLKTNSEATLGCLRSAHSSRGLNLSAKDKIMT